MPTENKPLTNSIYFGASPKLIGLAKELRKNMTQAEKLLWGKLKNEQLMGFKFRRQHPISSFIVDFYCHNKKLVIEIDGGYHNSGYQKEYDLGRSDELRIYGIHLIRFTNEEIEDNLDAVVNKIKEFIIT